MYKRINITENSLRVFSLFTNGFDKDYYIREVEKLLTISPRTAQLILEDLESKGLIESKARGKIKLYRLKINSTSRRYLAFAEQYKAISFLASNLLIKEAIEKITPFISGIGIIFGSYAKGTADKGSDLDIFVAGAYDEDEIKKVSRNLGLDISVKCYPEGAFEKNKGKDVLLGQILKNHVIFKNIEQFIEAVLENG